MEDVNQLQFSPGEYRILEFRVKPRAELLTRTIEVKRRLSIFSFAFPTEKLIYEDEDPKQAVWMDALLWTVEALRMKLKLILYCIKVHQSILFIFMRTFGYVSLFGLNWSVMMKPSALFVAESFWESNLISFSSLKIVSVSLNFGPAHSRRICFQWRLTSNLTPAVHPTKRRTKAKENVWQNFPIQRKAK